ncbi:MAG: VOC family protein [Planctomycetes bacterium]|nr:VOC family protein [Planctomycetota bacterium]
MRVGEINIICRDLEVSRAFYCDMLGFEALEYEGPEALHCRCSNARLLLLAVAKEAAPAAAYCHHACVSFDIITPDLAALVERLKASGATFAQEFNGSCAFVYDPDGNVVEMLQDGI